MTEIWKDIKDYEGLYQVSNLGRVRSVDRYRKNKGGSIAFVKGKIVRQEYKKGSKYLRVVLCKNGQAKHFSVHRLVAMTFPDLVDWTEDAKGKPFDELEVNHKDQNKENNCVWNLEWCDRLYNALYGDAIERRSEKQKLTMSTIKAVRQYTLDGQFVAEYFSIHEASRQTGLLNSNISACCKNKYGCKTCGGYIWRYSLSFPCIIHRQYLHWLNHDSR